MTHKIQALFRESFNMLSTIVFPLFFFLFFFREEIFSVIFKDKYNASIPIFAISIFILPLRINNYSVILQCFSQGKKIMMGSLIDIIIALILMVSLYPFMGSKGIALVYCNFNLLPGILLFMAFSGNTKNSCFPAFTSPKPGCQIRNHVNSISRHIFVAPKFSQYI